MARTVPIRCLSRVTANPATAQTTTTIQFRPSFELKRSPSRIRTNRIPTDIPPRMLKAVSPARRRDIKRPPRDPSAKEMRVTSARARSPRPAAFMTLTIVTQTTNRVSVASIRLSRISKQRLTANREDQSSRKCRRHFPQPHPG